MEIHLPENPFEKESGQIAKEPYDEFGQTEKKMEIHLHIQYDSQHLYY